MNRKEEIAKKVEEALESFAGVQQAEPAPFFYTRVRSQLEKNTLGWWESFGTFITRPVVAFASILLVVLLNAAVIYTQRSNSIQPAITEQVSEDDYSTVVAVSYNYENQGQ
ncbi:MAG: hypothetical protein HYR66_14105 [Sphingobacteriales bacterium]|nr:hypothetical protein [Sphingobacteriales bacterium]MBI3718648.1 hypothetical protein [Sphingobacteriales bacterium]